MRFLYVKKKEFPCRRCKIKILRGEVFVRTSYQNRDTNVWYGFNYHPGCYLDDFKDRFNKSYSYWKEQLIPPKKLGRPLKTNNPKEHRRLKSLLYYYIKKGIINESKIITASEKCSVTHKIEGLHGKIKALEEDYILG